MVPRPYTRMTRRTSTGVCRTSQIQLSNWTDASGPARLILSDTALAHVASCYFTMGARVGHGDDARSIVVEPLEYVDDIPEHVRADMTIHIADTMTDVLTRAGLID